MFRSQLRPRRLGMAFRPGLGVAQRESALAPSVRRRSDEMPALPAVRTARPPATKPALSIVPFDTLPLNASSESLAVSRSRSGSLFLLKNRIIFSTALSPLASRFRDRLDELTLGHPGSSLDTDAGREVDELRLVVGPQPTVRRVPIELARGVLGGQDRVLA